MDMDHLIQIVTVNAIAAGLAMDAFAVSIVNGAIFKELHIRHALRMAFFFGAFQAIMPLLGYAAGNTFAGNMTSIDHWIAFALLVGIGGKMIYESFKIRDMEKKSRSKSDHLAGLEYRHQHRCVGRWVYIDPHYGFHFSSCGDNRRGDLCFVLRRL
jgi:putative Mn2+ efflux pump MntP